MGKNNPKFMIPFNRPYYSENEINFVKESLESGKTSGDGKFTKKVNRFYNDNYDFQNCFLTTSCTDALEISALLLNIEPGDEIILPSYTFVSTANPFILRGAKLVFVDSEPYNPNISVEGIKSSITSKTKAIVIVHYAGIACDIDQIINIIGRKDILLIEDAAQAFDSFYKGKPLGSFGTFSTFSFHETKNITCGEGGLLVVNDNSFVKKAEIIREKGTNRSAFFRGEVDKYGWVEMGSSFLQSDILASILYSQLLLKDKIQAYRVRLWNYYKEAFKDLESRGLVKTPFLPDYASNNGHLFFVVFNSESDRNRVQTALLKNQIQTSFHYQSLHKSKFFSRFKLELDLPNSDIYSDCLLRFPMFFGLKFEIIDEIIKIINKEL